MTFEWDEKKNRTNEKKHGISFEKASLVFLDKHRIDFIDELHSLDEDRIITIGDVGGLVIIVAVHTERMYNGEAVMRLISARYATKREEELYYEENYT